MLEDTGYVLAQLVCHIPALSESLTACSSSQMPLQLNMPVECCCTAGDTVTFINENVQKQIGSGDCGLFALAFATYLCQGLDPTNQRCDQALMRQHYVTRLKSANVTPFPKTLRADPCKNQTKSQIFGKADKVKFTLLLHIDSL